MFLIIIIYFVEVYPTWRNSYLLDNLTTSVATLFNWLTSILVQGYNGSFQFSSRG